MMNASEIRGYRRGVLAAAALADEYLTTHPNRLSDCIAGRLSVGGRKKPRKNKRALDPPSLSYVHGAASALARACEVSGYRPEVVEAARSVGITLESVRRAGVKPVLVAALRKAGWR